MVCSIFSLLLGLNLAFIRTSIEFNVRADELSEVVLGKLWKWDEHCADTRNSSNLYKDDLRITKFHNGSTFRNYVSGGPSHIFARSQGLLEDQIKTFNTINIICSGSSWGYADQYLLLASNSAAHSKEVCYEELDIDYQVAVTIAKLNERKDDALTKTRVEGVLDQATNGNPLDEQRWSSLRQEILLKRLSSWGHVPSGLPYHSHVWLGDYRGCLADGSSRYCFGALSHPSWSRLPKNFIRVGMCLPKNCSSSDIVGSGRHLRQLDWILKLQLSNQLGLFNKLDYRLVDVFCEPDSGSQLRQLPCDWVSLGLMSLGIIWFFMTLYGSCISVFKESSNTFLACFDVYRNWLDFIRASRPGHELAALDGFKVITMQWLLVSHIFYQLIPQLTSIYEIRNIYRKSVLGTFIMSGQHGVPLFFMVSGLIVSHKWLRTNPEARPSAFELIRDRYLRLAPLYLLCYTFLKQFGHLLGSGPIWDYAVSEASEMRQCKLESWLVPVLMLANTIPPFSHCIITGWHVANDFHIYLVLPLVFQLYRWSRKSALLMIKIAFAVSHLYHIWSYYWSPTIFTEILASETHLFGPAIVVRRLGYDYVNPLGRLGNYLLGFWLSDFLIVGHGRNDSGSTSSKIDRRSRTKSVQGQTKDLQHQGRDEENENHIAPLDDSLREAQPHRPKQIDSNFGVKTSNKLDYPLERQTQTELTKQLDDGKKESSEDGRGQGRPVASSRWPTGRLVTVSVSTGLFMLGLSLIFSAVVAILAATSIHDKLGDFGSAFGYPSLRVMVELGWLAILVATLKRDHEKTNSKASGYNYYHLNLTCPPVDGKISIEKQANSMTTKRHVPASSVPSPSDKTTNHNRSIMATVHHYQPQFIVTHLFSLPFWNVLSKLNYCVMLTHFTVVRYVILGQTQLVQFSWLNMAQIILLTFTLIYSLALIVHLTIEIPLNKVIKRVFGT